MKKLYLAVIFGTIFFVSACGEKGYQKPTFPSEKSDSGQRENPPTGANPDPAAPGEPGSMASENPADSAAPDSRMTNDAFAAPDRPIARPLLIPGGKTLSVRLLETISSKTARPGQHFDAELASPIVVKGKTVLPRGTPLRGRVVSARSSGRLKHPGYLRLTLASVRTPDGRWVNLKTTSIWAQGKSHKKRNLTLIGGGTGLGAVIGAIAGGGKGAAIGAAAGAGAGTAGAYATGKKDVIFPAERKLSFATVREVVVGAG